LQKEAPAPGCGRRERNRLLAIEQNALIHSAIFATIILYRIGLFDFSPSPQRKQYFSAVRGLADHI
jgi:hypothetical protein